ncbi:MAG: thioredoxin family protein [Thaumarchaeota archaeon]|jgi:peroxiredoxin|nr:MAG: thioredoxin family protein [Nitrososphaerota archaeon]TLX85879.1 MAG: thioredoxin family protein [Nitrososphaerota archaeon]TLX91101.1 MAG: thioredoxin family protein [Nitrososphaerota archaeon]
MAKTLSSQTLKKNDTAPSFRLMGTDDKFYSLEDFRSKCLLIVFICNHCPYVKARIADLVFLQNKFSTSELQIVGINSNDPSYQDEGFENMVKFSKQNNLNFPYLMDETQQIAKSYGAVCTPDPFLFDQNRRLVFHGKINDAMEPEMTPQVHVMEKNIRKLLNGEIIEKDFDPSIGCSIKWKS